MKPNKIFWFNIFNITDQEIHFEFLNIFLAACGLDYFYLIIGIKNLKKRNLPVRFATWIFTFSGDGSRRIIFDLCGLKFWIRWFRTEPDPEYFKRLAPTS